MVMKKIIKGISLALMLMCVTLISGCGDDEGLPFWVDVTNADIDFNDPDETGYSLISVTIFDSRGNPMEDGTMVFTLSGGAGGTLVDEDNKPFTAISVDIDDGVAEILFRANPAVAETVYVTAYCPGYPNNKALTVKIVVTI